MAERELTATQWRAYGGASFPEHAWSIDGDVLRAVAGGERVDLITRDSFGDFALLFDWRLPRGGSSQVLCRVEEAAGPAEQTGPALQLLDDEHQAEGANALTSCGALYALIAPWREQRSAANAYHSGRIAMRGSAIECWIDDHQVIGCDLASEELRVRISRSRFRDFARFAQLPAGHIVLKHRGTEAWFRRLRVETA
jgi:3-keto-disaccharide hydrolase